MKFNEKLVELRKENALTQEELAEKVGVTRQTISKWELGETSPDTDKLNRLAEVFKVSVNELLDSNAINTTSKNETDTKRNKTIIIILVIVLVIVVLGIGYIVFNTKQKSEGIVDKAMNFIDNEWNMIGNMIEEEKTKQAEFDEAYNEVQNQIEENEKANSKHQEQFNKDSFNGKLKTLYYGNKSGFFMEDFYNTILKSNEENKNHIIEVNYNNEITTSDAEEIKNIRNNVDKNTKYEISYEYDKDGYINKAIVVQSN